MRTWRSSPEWRAGHDRDLGRLEVERLDPARLEEGQQPERLDRRAKGHDPVRVAERRISRPAASTSTMSPRWTLSSMPLRTWRTRTGRRRGRGRRARRASLAGDRPGWPGRSRSIGSPVGRARDRRRVTAEPRGYRGGCYDGRTATHVATFEPPGGAPCRPDPARLAAPGRPAQARRSCATRRPSPRSSARSCASCPGCSATRRWPTSASGRSRSGRRWRR